MKVKIKVNPYEKDDMLGYATINFDDKYVYENVRIKKSKIDGSPYIQMPQYRQKQKDENNFDVLDENGKQVYNYKDVFHPITSTSREDLYNNIINEYYNAKDGKREKYKWGTYTMSQSLNISDVYYNEFTSDKLHGFANVSFGEFALENVKLRYSDKGEYLDLPKYKTLARDDNGNVIYENGTPKLVYKDAFHPITKEAQEELLQSVSNARSNKLANVNRNLQNSQPVDDEILDLTNKKLDRGR